ncbi:hypothetical protein BDV23DRAFT_150607 [Aspergillus alliaceus]|uniref:Uncharacterized protein n=1 Tax=Petromyces alliaceus TaxID=209559 RepID=A0A5N7CG46_PETAA|nr:hypothetical protein BDV23DRAFT_150607 [Aspergillus alliaceus]
MQSVHRLKLHYGRKADDAGQGAIDVTEAEATWRTAPSTLMINTLDKCRSDKDLGSCKPTILYTQPGPSHNIYCWSYGMAREAFKREWLWT